LMQALRRRLRVLRCLGTQTDKTPYRKYSKCTARDTELSENGYATHPQIQTTTHTPKAIESLWWPQWYASRRIEQYTETQCDGQSQICKPVWCRSLVSGIAPSENADERNYDARKSSDCRRDSAHVCCDKRTKKRKESHGESTWQ